MIERPAPEFSRIVDLADLPNGGSVYDLSAGEDERAALAARFDLVSMSRLEARLRVVWRGDALRVDGDLRADVVQSCVVTLSPIESRLEERLELAFTRERPGETVGLDDAEPLTGDVLDIGELVAEELSLALDPYPRLPGAERPESADREVPRESPFDVLAKLKPKL